MIFYFRYGTVYRQVLKIPKIDICWVLERSSSNPLLSAIINIFKDSVPEIIHPCPYESVVINNKAFKVDSLPTFFSTGDYKITMELISKSNEQILIVEALVSWFSPEKNSFG